MGELQAVRRLCRVEYEKQARVLGFDDDKARSYVASCMSELG